MHYTEGLSLGYNTLHPKLVPSTPTVPPYHRGQINIIKIIKINKMLKVKEKHEVMKNISKRTKF